MDPNATLAAMRQLISELDESDPEHSRACALAEHLEAMDQWLSQGGFLPIAWQPRS